MGGGAAALTTTLLPFLLTLRTSFFYHIQYASTLLLFSPTLRTPQKTQYPLDDPALLEQTEAALVPTHTRHAESILFPGAREPRRYQADMVYTALFYNTLVCLPTGCGKTLISSVVMKNYFR
jgi:hypothetical protein